MMDSDVLVGHYPFRQFPWPSTDPQALKAYLQARGIEHACLASLNAIFYPDPHQGNGELFPLVAGDNFFAPVGTLNPSLQNWRHTLDRCIGEYNCRMVRLLPNYHQYSLSALFVAALMDEAQRRDLVVCIVKRVEDERMHNLLMKVPGVENSEIEALTTQFPQPLVVLSAYFQEIVDLAASCPSLFFDIAFAERLNTLRRLTATVPVTRLLFSTHTPFFYAEAAIAKLDTWAGDETAQQAVRAGNIRHLLKL